MEMSKYRRAVGSTAAMSQPSIGAVRTGREGEKLTDSSDLQSLPLQPSASPDRAALDFT